MPQSPQQPTFGATPTEWITWQASLDTAEATGEPWLQKFRLRTFQLLVGIAAAGLFLIVVRGFFVGGPFPWADLANALYFVAVLGLLRWRPEWLKPLAWLGLLSFFINSIDGFYPLSPQPISPAHVLVPLLVLYGALLGSLGMSLAAMGGVLTIYALTAWHYQPLSRTDTLILTNLCFVTVFSGVTAFAIWLQHRRFMERLRLQAVDLRKELDARLRLNAIIFHDISNPLGALMSASDLAKLHTHGGPPAELEIIDRMSERIAVIINSARDIDTELEIDSARVTVATLHAQLLAVFSARLKAKELTLQLVEGGDLDVRTNPAVLSNSVLGNLLSNAIKFSPRGTVIEMTATESAGQVRIEVRDQGQGFAENVLRQGARGRRYRSQPGTEGEAGSAYGLRIAALLLHRLQGRLEVKNRIGGGAAVSVVIPGDDAKGGDD